MAEHSTIEWTDATWNPITGCSVVSPGCTNCYAMGLAGTRLQHHPSRAGLTRPSKAGPVWNGEVRLNEEWLTQPLQWKRSRMIFVCAHGDLFHESVPDAWIDRVFAVMALCPQHTFQVLTKRSARMRAYCTSRSQLCGNIGGSAADIMLEHTSTTVGGVKTTHPLEAAESRKPAVDWAYAKFPNVWLGVSAEDQRRADERVPDLLATPAAVRFVSAEPLLGPIDFTRISLGMKPGCVIGENGEPDRPEMFKVVRDALMDTGGDFERLDWIIVGGESGPGARPMHPDWARQIRNACAANGVAFHFKQHGAWAAIDQSAGADEAGWQGRGDWMILSADGDLDIPDDRWPDETAGEVAVVRVGKKAAGRLLDGVEHNGMPEART